MSFSLFRCLSLTWTIDRVGDYFGRHEKDDRCCCRSHWLRQYQPQCIRAWIEELDSPSHSDGRQLHSTAKSIPQGMCAIPPTAIQKLRSRPKWSLIKETTIRAIHAGPLLQHGPTYPSWFVNVGERAFLRLPRPDQCLYSLGTLPIQRSGIIPFKLVVVRSISTISDQRAKLKILKTGQEEACRWSVPATAMRSK